MGIIRGKATYFWLKILIHYYSALSIPVIQKAVSASAHRSQLFCSSIVEWSSSLLEEGALLAPPLNGISLAFFNFMKMSERGKVEPWPSFCKAFLVRKGNRTCDVWKWSVNLLPYRLACVHIALLSPWNKDRAKPNLTLLLSSFFHVLYNSSVHHYIYLKSLHLQTIPFSSWLCK